jgi:hypothetical protein
VKIVEVHWLDAWVDTSEITIKQALKKKPILTISIGHLVAENDDGIVMVTDVYPNSPKKGRITSFVPWGMVAEYYEYQDS